MIIRMEYPEPVAVILLLCVMRQEEYWNLNRAGWAVALGLGTALILIAAQRGWISAEGSYMGVLSRNLAEGIGSFWYPAFSQDPPELYHELPPLAIGMEAVFFKIFGDRWPTEKIFSLSILVMNVLVLMGIWRAMGERWNTAWVPLAFWMSVPAIIDATAQSQPVLSSGLFASLSCLTYLISFQRRSLAGSILSAGFGVAAFLSGGYIALAVLAFTFWWILFFQGKTLRMFVWFGLATFLFFILILAFVFWVQPAAVDNVMNKYLTILALDRMYEEPNVGNRLWILMESMRQIAPLLLIAIMAMGIVWQRSHALSQTMRSALPFLLTGFCFIALIAQERRQFVFEAYPAFIFLALGLSLISVRSFEVFQAGVRGKFVPVFSAAAFFLLLAWVLFHQSTDEGAMRQKKFAVEFKLRIEEPGQVATTTALKLDKGFKANMMRWARVGLSESEGNAAYFISADTLPPEFTPVFDFQGFQVGRRKDGTGL